MIFSVLLSNFWNRRILIGQFDVSVDSKVARLVVPFLGKTYFSCF